MFKFDEKKLIDDELLGVGSSGQVFAYQKDSNDKKWVVKVVLVKNVESLFKLLDEIVLGFNCRHPAILPIRGYFIEPLKKGGGFQVYIKMPRMERSLNDFIKEDRENFPEEKVVKWLYSLLSGLEYLHNNRIIHRDVKPSNTLISEEGDIKLADIGSAKLLSEEEMANSLTKIEGTYSYLAPEVWENRKGLKKQDLFLSDVWGLGVSMIELCLKKTQLVDFKDPALKKTLETLLLNVQSKYSSNLSEILRGMTHIDYKQRNSVKDTLDLIKVKYENIIKENEDFFLCEKCKILQRKINTLNRNFSNEKSDMIKIQEEFIEKMKNLQNQLNGKNQVDHNRNIALQKELEEQKEKFKNLKTLLEEKINTLNRKLENMEVENKELSSVNWEKELVLNQIQNRQEDLQQKFSIQGKELKWFQFINELNLKRYCIVFQSEKYLSLRIRESENQNDCSFFNDIIQARLSSFKVLNELELVFGQKKHNILKTFLLTLKVSDKLSCHISSENISGTLQGLREHIDNTRNLEKLRRFELSTDCWDWSLFIEAWSLKFPEIEELSIQVKFHKTSEKLETVLPILTKRFSKLHLLKLTLGKSFYSNYIIPKDNIKRFCDNFIGSSLKIALEICYDSLIIEQDSINYLNDVSKKDSRIKIII